MNKEVLEASEFLKNNEINNDETFKYQLLGRMQNDCEVYIKTTALSRNPNKLWALNEQKQIDIMKNLYLSFPDDKKPFWISMNDIENYEKCISIFEKSYKDTIYPNEVKNKEIMQKIIANEPSWILLEDGDDKYCFFLENDFSVNYVPTIKEIKECEDHEEYCHGTYAEMLYYWDCDISEQMFDTKGNYTFCLNEDELNYIKFDIKDYIKNKCEDFIYENDLENTYKLNAVFYNLNRNTVNAFASAVYADSNNKVKVIAFNPFSDSSRSLSDYSVDTHDFDLLQESASVAYISDSHHYETWCSIIEQYPTGIKNIDGMQKYLDYCKENNITKEYLTQKYALPSCDILNRTDINITDINRNVPIEKKFLSDRITNAKNNKTQNTNEKVLTKDINKER
ncbi:MAG: LPD11 domain-containing protein [Bacilli bacterium]